MLLDILYPDWIQNQKSYIENMLFIILTYHEINRNSIFAPLLAAWGFPCLRPENTWRYSGAFNY